MKSNPDLKLMESLIKHVINLLNNPQLIEEILSSNQARFVPMLNKNLKGKEWIEMTVATAGKCLFEHEKLIEARCPGLGDKLKASWARYMSHMSLKNDLDKSNFN